jgi:hypothetical protein
MDRNMGRVFIMIKIQILITKENGKMAKEMDMVY